MKQIVLGPGESHARDGRRVRVMASSEDCDERFCLLESVIEAGQGPALHLHRKHLEAFYVLDGTLDVQAGHDHVSAPAGSFVLCPAGSPHTFRNPGPGEARFFGFAAPGGLDRFLEGLGAIFRQPGPPDVKALGELLRRYESEAPMGFVPEGPATTVLGPGDGETMTIADNTVTFLADSASTGGICGVVDYTAGPRFRGPPPHLHHETAEVFFVLEGELAMRLGDEALTLLAGGFVLVPPGTVHTFSNQSDAPVRFLGLVSPGGFEQYFRDVGAALADGPLDPAVIREISSRYDIENA
jgi:mannose-6-phosphate isomerase-like protein (cupin superfamily)